MFLAAMFLAGSASADTTTTYSANGSAITNGMGDISGSASVSYNAVDMLSGNPAAHIEVWNSYDVAGLNVAGGAHSSATIADVSTYSPSGSTSLKTYTGDGSSTTTGLDGSVSGGASIYVPVLAGFGGGGDPTAVIQSLQNYSATGPNAGGGANVHAVIDTSSSFTITPPPIVTPPIIPVIPPIGGIPLI